MSRCLLLFFLTATLCTCKVKKINTLVINEDMVPCLWASMTLYVTKTTQGNTPTYASRALGYIGLTMYESIVNGYPNYASMQNQLNGLTNIEKPATGKKYNWTIVLNAGQAHILKNIYAHTSDENKKKIDSLENEILQQLTNKNENDEIINLSVKYGRSIANSIFEWSKTDGGHRAYLKNFDKSFIYPSDDGMWKPPLYGQSFSRFPLHPKWGNNRTFLKENTTVKYTLPKKYSRDTSSLYYQEFNAVYLKNKILTQEEKNIALWWHDDPAETYSPPGHSYNLASIAIKKVAPGIMQMVETYAKTGIAVADAFIMCWKMKYTYFSERPSTYIIANIDEEWQPFWPDPPFPAFPSGHATQAAAVAEILTGIYGDNFSFIDSTHFGRPKDEIRNVSFEPRKYKSFWHVAEETAASRFFGGIHTNQDNITGLEIGKKIGENINALKWKLK